MLLKVFSIFDAKSSGFARPFFSFNDATAQREVAASVVGGDSLLSRFPEDYQLYEVGTFDDGTGRLEALVPAQFICNLGSLKESSK